MQQSLIAIVGLIVFCGVLIAGVSYWLGGAEGPAPLSVTDETIELAEPMPVLELPPYEPMNINSNNPVAVITTNFGVIELELFDDAMPITAGNFAKLTREGFYDGTKFHRVIENFMIQGGDPNSKTDEVLTYGTGDPGYAIPDEHIVGEKLTNVRGTIAMANSGPETGGSQFFINLIDNQRLDWNVPDPNNSAHPVFGQVIAGMDVVDTIARVETGMSSVPIEPVIVESVVIKE